MYSAKSNKIYLSIIGKLLINSILLNKIIDSDTDLAFELIYNNFLKKIENVNQNELQNNNVNNDNEVKEKETSKNNKNYP